MLFYNFEVRFRFTFQIVRIRRGCIHNVAAIDQAWQVNIIPYAKGNVRMIMTCEIDYILLYLQDQRAGTSQTGPTSFEPIHEKKTWDSTK